MSRKNNKSLYNTFVSPFKKKVIQAVERIPYGKVASYGQIALIIGFPRGAREVGWILNSTEGDREVDIPWWRVINNSGRISIKGTVHLSADLQRKLLRAEGIEINDLFELDIEKHRFRPTEDELKDLELAADYIQMILEKYKI